MVLRDYQRLAKFKLGDDCPLDLAPVAVLGEAVAAALPDDKIIRFVFHLVIRDAAILLDGALARLAFAKFKIAGETQKPNLKMETRNDSQLPTENPLPKLPLPSFPMDSEGLAGQEEEDEQMPKALENLPENLLQIPDEKDLILLEDLEEEPTQIHNLAEGMSDEQMRNFINELMKLPKR